MPGGARNRRAWGRTAGTPRLAARRTAPATIARSGTLLDYGFSDGEIATTHVTDPAARAPRAGTPRAAHRGHTRASAGCRSGGSAHDAWRRGEIGRASCRERVFITV